MEDIKFASILPYSTNHRGELVILLGLEAKSQDWDTFGGRLDFPSEDYRKAAAREGYEESMGLLGTKDSIYYNILDIEPVYYEDVAIFPYRIKYDESLSLKFDGVFDYIRDLNPSFKTGYLEKLEISWFNLEGLYEIELRNPKTILHVLSELYDRIR